MEESLTLQKTGAEEVSSYTRDMEELVIRSKQPAEDPKIKAEAKRKLEELENDWKKVEDDPRSRAHVLRLRYKPRSHLSHPHGKADGRQQRSQPLGGDSRHCPHNLRATY